MIGLPHPDLGEAVTAVIIADGPRPPQLDEIITALTSKLARFKQPRRVFYIDELPRNAMGKVQKNVLRSLYQDTFTG